MAVPGVLLVLTHETLGTEIRPVKHALGGGWANSTWRPLASADIAYVRGNLLLPGLGGAIG